MNRETAPLALDHCLEARNGVLVGLFTRIRAAPQQRLQEPNRSLPLAGCEPEIETLCTLL
jgi:hypothetical protein